MHKLALLLLLPALSSCWGPFPLEAKYSYYGSAENFAKTEAAAREWDQCGAKIILTQESGFTPVIEVEHIVDDPNDGFSGLTRWYQDATTKRISWIQLRYTMRPDSWTRTAAHEFGHSLGLGHVQEGLMNPRGPDTDTVGGLECHHVWEVQ